MKRRHALARIAAAAAATSAPAALFAQGDQPITIVVPYPPAGTADMLGRLLAQQMAPLLGRTIVVDNRPGAGSGIGAAFVARAPADGQTLLIATSTTLAINPSLYQKLGYDPARDFTPIGMIGAVPLLVVVNPALPAHDLAELVALSRSRSGGLRYGSGDIGSPQHLGPEMFKAATGARLTHVPYPGSGPAVTGLLDGQIDLMFCEMPAALQHVKAGKLRALAVTSDRRQAALPQVPTVAESGVAGTHDFEAVDWQSLVAPAGTPKAVVQQYADAMARVLAQPELRARLAADGFEPARPGLPPERLAAYISSETERWAQVVRASGASAD